MRILKWFSFIAIFLLLLPLLAFAQADPWERDVRSQLARASITFEEFSLTRSHQPVLDSLRNKQAQGITYTLQGGASYVFLGVCDQDCASLRLALYDADGNLIAVDGGSVTPHLIVQIYRTDYFLLRVTMERCNQSPCRYGVGTYIKE